jgi:hypothetical protein
MLEIKVANNSRQLDERDAQVDDLFYEVGYEEVWKVTESGVTESGMNGCRAVVVSYRGGYCDECWPIGHTSFWGYTHGWHGANLVRVKK